jgi:pyruvate/2-oxoglutarate/acetoin dehydrogenase E1 component
VIGELIDRFGPKAASPVSYHEQNWTVERYSGGGMISHAPPGVLTEFGPALRAPCGRIHWAGTESSAIMCGWIDGAVRSGERAAAEVLAAEGVSVEVVDLRTIAPLDRETVLASLAKTNRLVIAHEAVRDFGVGAELAALAVDEGFWHLDAPVTRVAPPPMPAPYAPSLERLWLPSKDTVAETVRRIAAV